MTSSQHVFHTKHDFAPEHAWTAFQLLLVMEGESCSLKELHTIAGLIASPLAKRADLNKLAAALHELDLIERERSEIKLSACGHALANGIGKYELGFYAGVHCLYFWRWLWSGEERLATPSWSYGETCRYIANAGLEGITPDDLVMRVVASAIEKFAVEKASFSRSSVGGVVTWLEAQAPPLISRDGNHIHASALNESASTDMLRLNLAALCILYGGEAEMNVANTRLLAAALLCRRDEAVSSTLEFAQNSDEFALVQGGTARVIFKSSSDAFLSWMSESQTCLVE